MNSMFGNILKAQPSWLENKKKNKKLKFDKPQPGSDKGYVVEEKWYEFLTAEKKNFDEKKIWELDYKGHKKTSVFVISVNIMGSLGPWTIEDLIEKNTTEYNRREEHHGEQFFEMDGEKRYAISKLQVLIKKIVIIPNKYMIFQIPQSDPFNRDKKTIYKFDPNNGYYDHKWYNFAEKKRYTKRFELVAAVIHVGNNTNRGHYYSIVKYNNIWYNYSDSIITNRFGNSPVITGETETFAMLLYKESSD